MIGRQLRISLKTKLAILAVLTAATILIWQQVLARQGSQLLLVEFFDVGQGDSIFIQAPNKNQVLIDGGPSDKVLERLAKAMPAFDKSLDLIILTHPDADHLSGLIEVLKYYQVSQIISSPAETATDGFKQWLALIREKNIPFKYGQAGQQIKIAQQIRLDIVYPFSGNIGETKQTNAFSVVSRLCYLAVCFLLPGDLETPQENILLQTQFNLESQVLKIAHHGSKNATGNAFLQRIKPEIAVISVGKENRFGHPNQKTMERLKNYILSIWRTDEQSDIKITTDGKELFLPKR